MINAFEANIKFAEVSLPSSWENDFANNFLLPQSYTVAMLYGHCLMCFVLF